MSGDFFRMQQVGRSVMSCAVTITALYPAMWMKLKRGGQASWETHTTLYTQFLCLVCSCRLLSASWDKSVICWDMNSSEQIVSSCRRCGGSVRSWMYVTKSACAKFVVYKDIRYPERFCMLYCTISIIHTLQQSM